MSKRLIVTALSALTLTAGVQLADVGTADAGVRIRAGGSITVRGGRTRVRPRPRPVRPVRPLVQVGGGIRVGGWVRYSNPPPPVVVTPGYCDCAPQPTYAPIAPVATGIGYVAAPRPALPRWGLGVFAGGVALENQEAGTDYGVAGRVRLLGGLYLDGEIAKSQVESDATRVDRRAALGLTWDISPYRRLSPTLIGAVGAIDTQVGSEYQTTQAFSEVGLGLRYGLTERVHLFGDIRAGSRAQADDGASPRGGATARVAPAPDETEEYTSARIGAMLFF
jgi:hypothetical protein